MEIDRLVVICTFVLLGVGTAVADTNEMPCYRGPFRDTLKKEIVDLEFRLAYRLERASILTAVTARGERVSANLACPVSRLSGLCGIEDDGGTFYMARKGETTLELSFRSPLFIARENNNVFGLEVGQSPVREEKVVLRRTENCGKRK